MAYDLAAVLRAEGLTVHEVPGWQRRSAGGSGMAAAGVMVHHTATPPSPDGKTGWTDDKVRRLLVDGRKGIPGPLSQIGLRRDGTVEVIAAGKANHAGRGSKKVLAEVRKSTAPSGSAKERRLADDEHGNRHFIGVECYNDGQGEGWSRQQMAALEGVCAALCRAEGWSANRVIGHREWTSRKIDPHGVNMASLRTVVAHRLSGPMHAQPPPPKGKTSARPVPSWEEAAVNSLPTLGKGAGRTGSENGWVKRVQGLLLAWGQTVTLDGQFGPNTERSVKAFQKRAGIAQDGIVGRGTWQKLLGL